MCWNALEKVRNMASDGYPYGIPSPLPSRGCEAGSAVSNLLQPRHVLYIEDNVINQIYVQAILEPMGYFVDIAEDGAAGLAMAVRGQYHLILLDGRLPDLSGLEVLRRLRQQSLYRVHTPVIIISADIRPENTAAYLANGANMFLSKPFRHDELLMKVAEFD
jgi:CheY-like chemotaxis protein